jgi:23S rRNA (pseudouridine1915-N3)-methyltransferase
MKLILAAVGRLKAGPERDLVARYEQRARAACRAIGLTGFEMREIEESRARRAEDRKAEEARALLALLPANARLVALDERGKAMGSEAFAADLGKTRDSGAGAYALLIGGPDGLDESLRARADFALAFGAMTWPHQIVRILAAEQAYRAITILAGHPYHRA